MDVYFVLVEEAESEISDITRYTRIKLDCSAERQPCIEYRENVTSFSRCLVGQFSRFHVYSQRVLSVLLTLRCINGSSLYRRYLSVVVQANVGYHTLAR